MNEEILYRTPIVNSWGAVTFVNRTGAIDPDHRHTIIFLDKDDRPRRLSDAEKDPGATEGIIVVCRRTGDPTPTPEEIQVCDTWRKTVAGTGIKLVDFIIICGGSHYSFASEKVEGPGPKGF